MNYVLTVSNHFGVSFKQGYLSIYGLFKSKLYSPTMEEGSIFQATSKNLIYTFIVRLGESRNHLVCNLINTDESDPRYTPGMWRYWNQELYIYFNIIQPI